MSNYLIRSPQKYPGLTVPTVSHDDIPANYYEKNNSTNNKNNEAVNQINIQTHVVTNARSVPLRCDC